MANNIHANFKRGGEGNKDHVNLFVTLFLLEDKFTANTADG